VEAPVLLLALIHPSAWKGNSQNFALVVFAEVPHSPDPFAVGGGLATGQYNPRGASPGWFWFPILPQPGLFLCVGSQ
jgi:hypothetical protein